MTLDLRTPHFNITAFMALPRGGRHHGDRVALQGQAGRMGVILDDSLIALNKRLAE